MIVATVSLANPLVLEIARSIAIDYEVQEFAGAFPKTTPARVTIEINGNRLDAQVDYPLGDVANPMSTEDIAQKIIDFDGQRAERAEILLTRIRALRHSVLGELIERWRDRSSMPTSPPTTSLVTW